MKKNYITPEINVIQFEALCNGGLATCSVYKGQISDKSFSNFDVVNEDATKTGDEYKGLWGESNSGKWGDD